MSWWAATQIFMCIFCSWWETKLIMITMQTNTIFLPYHAFRALTDVEFFFSIKNYHISSWPKYRWCSSASVLHLYSNHFYVDPVNLNTKWRKQVQQILSTTTIQTFKENHRTFLHFNWGNTVPVFGVDMQRPSVSTEDVFVLNEITETEYRPTKPDHPHLNN